MRFWFQSSFLVVVIPVYTLRDYLPKAHDAPAHPTTLCTKYIIMVHVEVNHYKSLSNSASEVHMHNSDVSFPLLWVEGRLAEIFRGSPKHVSL